MGNGKLFSTVALIGAVKSLSYYLYDCQKRELFSKCNPGHIYSIYQHELVADISTFQINYMKTCLFMRVIFFFFQHQLAKLKLQVTAHDLKSVCEILIQIWRKNLKLDPSLVFSSNAVSN